MYFCVHFSVCIQEVTEQDSGLIDKEDKDSVLNNANEVHKVKYFRKGVNLFRKTILRKVLFEILELTRCSLGRLSVVYRWSEARYKRDKGDCNLNKTHFFRFGVLSRFLGSSLVHRWSFVRCIYIRYKGKRILRNSIFTQKKDCQSSLFCVLY